MQLNVRYVMIIMIIIIIIILKLPASFFRDVDGDDNELVSTM